MATLKTRILLSKKIWWSQAKLLLAQVYQLYMGCASVRVWREKRGMTQDDLARRVGLSKSFLSEIENGKKTGSVKTLRGIAEALGIDLTRLAV